MPDSKKALRLNKRDTVESMSKRKREFKQWCENQLINRAIDYNLVNKSPEPGVSLAPLLLD